MSKGSEPTKLRISEVKTVLSHVIQNNRFLEKSGKKKNSILIESEAGIGKTSIVQQIAKENNLGFVKINLSNVEQAGDLCGFPLREFELTDGRWINEKELDILEKKPALSGKTRTSYCPPAWVPTDNKGVVLLLDDFTRAPTHIMQAVMEIIDRGEYISWKLPADCHVFLTSNPADNGDYIVTALDSAQKTRFIRLCMKFDVNEWATWAEFEGIDSRCINFLLMNPEMIKGDVNARLATDYFNSISSLPNFDAEYAMSMISLLGEGSVGPEFTTTFILFVNNKLDKVPSPESILMKGTEESVTKDLQSCFGKINSNSYKQNIASVVSTRIINYLDKMIASGSFSKKETFPRVLHILKEDIFSGDIKFNLIKTLNTKRQFNALIDDHEIRKIVSR